jgi:hypothetical protein
MNNNMFSKTLLPNIQSTLNEKFGEQGNSIFTSAEQILSAELNTVDERDNKVIGKHIRRNILPGYACYKAMLNAGVPNIQAIAFVEHEMCKSAQHMGKLCSKLSKKFYAYRLVQTLFCLGMKFAYPKEGWKVEKLEISMKRIRFNMNSCLYCEELEKRGALELCTAFCQTDHTTYDPLSPAVVFKRKTTIAKGATYCDFCFERGTIL